LSRLQVLEAPQLALTYHNDLSHIAALLLLLPLAHAQQLRPLLGAGEPAFLEDAALLRAAAAQAAAAALHCCVAAPAAWRGGAQTVLRCQPIHPASRC
jgi:hypothetical protein